MKKILLTGTAIIVALLAIYLLFFNKKTEHRSEAPTQMPTIKAPIDWSKVDRAEMTEMIDEFEAVKKETRIKISAFIAEGESLITDAIEEEDGIFVFTSITPELSSSPDGDYITTKTKVFSVALDGSQSVLSAPSVMSGPGQEFMISTGTSDGRGWSLKLEADLVPGGFTVSGSSGMK